MSKLFCPHSSNAPELLIPAIFFFLFIYRQWLVGVQYKKNVSLQKNKGYKYDSKEEIM